MATGVTFNKSFSLGNAVTLIVIAAGLAVQWGGWSASMNAMDGRLTKVEEQFNGFMHFRAATEANRFTSGDALAMLKPIMDSNINSDKRLTRLEDTMERTENILVRLERKLDEIEKGKRL